jgi:tRNA pseudouridine55 synthase
MARPDGPDSPDGVLLVDKPAGITSHDVIDITRRRLGVERVGHGGTLDLPATGLLLLLVGRATRLRPFVASNPKEYEAEILFGCETTTDDAAGVVIRESHPPAEASVRAAIPAFTGELLQTPPAFSAKRRGGTRSYRAARKGRDFPLEAVPVRVHEWRDVDFRDKTLRATIVCEGGTYIRALARDIGRYCGSAAHLHFLRRTRLGEFHLRSATPVHEIERCASRLLPPLAAVGGLHRVMLSPEDENMVVHGRRISAEGVEPLAALVGPGGDLVAVAERSGGEWKTRVVLADA